MQDINTHNIQKLVSLITKAGKIAVVSHMKPDGDALGSCLGMYHFLSACGKEDKRIILPNCTPSYLDFLMDRETARKLLIHDLKPAQAEAAIAESDLIICLDFNAFHRTDSLERCLEDSKAEKILIDHHLNPDRDRFTLSFSETEISSASELTYSILMQTPRIGGDARKLPSEAALALMTGMTTDTNNFANSVFPSTLTMASELIASGVDRDDILCHLLQSYRENRVRAFAHLLGERMVVRPEGYAYIIMNYAEWKNFGLRDGALEGLVNVPLSIREVRLSLFLREDEPPAEGGQTGGKFRVSIRSKRGVSANRLAGSFFHGGGHEQASGGKLFYPGDIAGPTDAALYVDESVREFLLSGTENAKDDELK